MSSEPPLCGGMASQLGAAELGVDEPVVAKVVFTWHRARLWLKLTVSVRTVSMQKVAVGTLMEIYGLMDADVAADVDVFHFLALIITEEVDDVEILEGATDVVSEIDSMSRVAACCSPVGGVIL